MSNPPAGDKRSVTTDALATLGTILKPGEKRDAIHLAVEPVTAGEKLYPGDHVTIKDGIAMEAPIGKGQGVVDPFLPDVVRQGQLFWFVMYPRQVHSLRHVWTHPDFPDEAGTPAPAKRDDARDTAYAMNVRALENAKAVVTRIAESIGGECEQRGTLTYDVLMEGANEWVDSGYHCTQQGNTNWQDDFRGHEQEFWTAWEIITGKKAPDHEAQFFSCSC